MELKENGFYLIKDTFFEKMNDSSLPFQKRGRPIFYCFSDKKNSNIFWCIPMTRQIEKVKKYLEKDKKNFNYVINPYDKKSAFNIGDIFPVTKNYIEREFEKRGVHFVIKDENLINNVKSKAKKIIKIKMLNKRNCRGINIIAIYDTLSKELLTNQEIPYNSLTGNEIPGIEAREDSRWIARADIIKHNIEIQPGAKGVETKIYGIEEGKLYEVPITYYNVKDLKITKELEQKFVPRKEKEQSQELAHDKKRGLGIAD